jgi:hypothetical protein
MRKTTVYITIAIVLLALYFYNKTKTEMSTTTPNIPLKPSPNDIKAAFEDLKKNYGRDFANKIEKLYRLETGHFESGQFKEGNSPGMVARKSTYPFGWASLDEFNKSHSIDGRFNTIGKTFVVDGKNYRYVGFPDFKTALNFVSWFIRTKRGGVVEKWNSLDPAAAAKYLNKLNSITTQYT